ncbi:uncharacterized protein LOC114260996 [Camellia sinensis]|uniref:uncharacterized protein LOC114260996 n=1 Tax=Camellia sinensis TaxID=4442 RepID=UPI0010364E8D|nr:uncharacterized protein LOC114260996 [Camellia sinensis]
MWKIVSRHKNYQERQKARSIYYQEEFNRRFLELDLVEWQKQLLVILEVVPDRRTIYWVYGRKGGEGKSTFGIYLIATKRAIMFNGGRREDVIFAYDYQNIAILDAARCQDIRYDIIEHFKDGVLFNQKYESHVMYFCPIHVVVLCNVLPDYSKVSEDRIHLIEL